MGAAQAAELLAEGDIILATRRRRLGRLRSAGDAAQSGR
jgi:hypothetical protein